MSSENASDTDKAKNLFSGKGLIFVLSSAGALDLKQSFKFCCLVESSQNLPNDKIQTKEN